MKVFIPSKGRAEMLSTHKIFPESVVLLHSYKEWADYADVWPELEEQGRLVVTETEGEPFGKTRQMEFACESLVDKDEWFCFADDNIKKVTAVIPEHYQEPQLDTEVPGTGAYWRESFNTEISSEDFFNRVAADSISEAQRIGASLIGFSLTDNVLFRSKKFNHCAFVIGSLCIWQNTKEIPFDHSISMEDFYFTAAHLEKYGSVLVNNFCFPKKKHYDNGGLGPYVDRLPHRKADVPRLLEMFPRWLKVKDRVGFEPNTDLRIVRAK